MNNRVGSRVECYSLTNGDDLSEVRWFDEDEFVHRDDGPAAIWDLPDRPIMAWQERGQLHRDGAPAAIYANGRLEWWWRGKIHRVGGPAVISYDGSLTWAEHGNLILTLARGH